MDTLTVNIKGNPVSFTTDLLWPDAINILRGIANKSPFAASLLEREDKKLHMSQAQVCWVYKLAEDELKRERKVEQKPQITYDGENLLNSLLSALDQGIKRPVIRLAYNSEEVKIKYVRLSGKCWITLGSELVGAIDTETGDMRIFSYKLKGESAEFIDFMVKANQNLQKALESYGRYVGKCGCCGLPLTNSKSIELGIGPICAEKYNVFSGAAAIA